jgi:hypothetical protein
VGDRFIEAGKAGMETYRAHIGSCDALAVEVNWFRHTCNTIRPHAAIGDRPPRAVGLSRSAHLNPVLRYRFTVVGMEITTSDRRQDSWFAPQACTLPTAEQPLRVAEFTELFASAVRTVVRSSPTTLRLVLDGDPRVEATARELAARETQCCSFFTFSFASAGAESLELTVAVPPVHVAVLDGLQRLADSAAPDDGQA